MKIKRRITQHARPNGQIILECYDNSTAEGRKQTLNEALEKLYEFEEMLDNGELLTKEERLKRCREHYEQGKFDAMAEKLFSEELEDLNENEGEQQWL